MTQKMRNPLDKIVGLHVTVTYSDGVIMNMTRRKAMEYVRTLGYMKECEEMEESYMFVADHHKEVNCFHVPSVHSMEIISYDTIR